jgi:T4 RnlA family RNA ligase
MNTFHHSLFTGLMDLVAINDSFYFKDFNSGSHTFRIFNYRLATYTDFLQPAALEARGVMFEVDCEGNPIEIKALPMPKFFNFHENPFTTNLDLTQIEHIFLKADGSLMSTYIEDNELKLKSKGSISSEQCIAAMNWLNSSTNEVFYEDLKSLTLGGYTVNLEWCSPFHRIVIGYTTPHLKVLNCRSYITGGFMKWDDLVSKFEFDRIIEKIQTNDPVAFVNDVPEIVEDIEGFVFVMKDSTVFKRKTTKYITLHHTKDSINMPRRLFECVIRETSDDLRSLFVDDVGALELIKDMEDRVVHRFDAMIKTVERFYDENKTLSRKDYAIKGQTEDDGLFSLKMNLFLENANDYKTFAIKHIDMFDIHDPDPIIDSE